MRKFVPLLVCLAVAGCASLTDRAALAKLSTVGVVYVVSNAEIGWYGEEKSSGGMLVGAMNLLSNSGKQADPNASAVLSRADALIGYAEGELLAVLSRAGGVLTRSSSEVLSSNAYAKAGESGMMGLAVLKPQGYKFVDANNASFTKGIAAELGLDASVQANFQFDKKMKTGLGKTGIMSSIVQLHVSVFDKTGNLVFRKSYFRTGAEDIPVAAGIADPFALQESIKKSVTAVCGELAADFSH